MSFTSSSFFFRFFFAGYLALILVLSGCSSTDNAQQYSGDAKDPLESINRPMWTFTWDYADKYVLKPASELYVNQMNPNIRAGLYNMVLNLNEPSAIINNILQGDFDNAAKSTGRFVLNSTIGMLGIFDLASDFGWMKKQEEFGEVLGYYGVGDGPYLVLPGLGPTSLRAEVGDYIDHHYWPLALLDFWPNVFRMGIVALEKRAELVDQEQLIEDSFDNYEFVKNAYFQNMRYKVYDGDPPIEEIEEFDDELEEYMDEFDEIDDYDEAID